MFCISISLCLFAFYALFVFFFATELRPCWWSAKTKFSVHKRNFFPLCFLAIQQQSLYWKYSVLYRVSHTAVTQKNSLRFSSFVHTWYIIITQIHKLDKSYKKMIEKIITTLGEFFFGLAIHFHGNHFQYENSFHIVLSVGTLNWNFIERKSFR